MSDRVIGRCYLVVEGEVDASLRDGDRARLGVDDGVVDVGEDAVGGDHVDVPVRLLVPRRTQRVRHVRVRLVVQQLTTTPTTGVILGRYEGYAYPPPHFLKWVVLHPHF